MIILTRVILITCLLMSVSACRANDGFDNIVYEVKSYEWWPIIVFLDSPNIPKNKSFQKYSMARTGGYNSNYATRPARNIEKLSDDPAAIKFNITWYEILTKKLYSADVKIDSRNLKPDPIKKGFGILIFRIAGHGDLEVITYEKSYPPDKKSLEPIILDQVCGNEIPLSDFTRHAELERKLADPYTMEGGNNYTRIEDLPSRCD